MLNVTYFSAHLPTRTLCRCRCYCYFQTTVWSLHVHWSVPSCGQNTQVGTFGIWELRREELEGEEAFIVRILYSSSSLWVPHFSSVRFGSVQSWMRSGKFQVEATFLSAHKHNTLYASKKRIYSKQLSNGRSNMIITSSKQPFCFLNGQSLLYSTPCKAWKRPHSCALL